MTSNISAEVKDTMTDPVKEFWERKVLQKTSGIEHLGGFHYELLFCFFLSYVIIYFCLFKGVRWTGKVTF